MEHYRVMSEYPPDATRTPYALSTYAEAFFPSNLGLPPVGSPCGTGRIAGISGSYDSLMTICILLKARTEGRKMLTRIVLPGRQPTGLQNKDRASNRAGVVACSRYADVHSMVRRHA